METLWIIIYVSLWLSLMILLFLYFKKDTKIITYVDESEAQELRLVVYDLKCINRKLRNEVKEYERKVCDYLDEIDKLKEAFENAFKKQNKYKDK